MYDFYTIISQPKNTPYHSVSLFTLYQLELDTFVQQMVQLHFHFKDCSGEELKLTACDFKQHMTAF